MLSALTLEAPFDPDVLTEHTRDKVTGRLFDAIVEVQTIRSLHTFPGEKGSEDFRKNDKEPDEHKARRCEKRFSFFPGVLMFCSIWFWEIRS